MSRFDSPAGQSLPSGDWHGFYVEPTSSRRFTMELFLKFPGTDIFGEGRDIVGEFTITGRFDPESGSCRWDKHYTGQHTVDYIGQSRARGIVGNWHLPGEPDYWTGPFFIWPRAFGDLHSSFVREYLEFELTGNEEFYYVGALDSPLQPAATAQFLGGCR